MSYVSFINQTSLDFKLSAKNTLMSFLGHPLVICFIKCLIKVLIKSALAV